MPSAKQVRAAVKRHAKWHPTRHGLTGQRHILQIAAEQCGQVLVTVPEKNSKFMPGEVEQKWLDTFTYAADPSDVRELPPHDACDCDICSRISGKPVKRRRVTAADRAKWDAQQDPMMRAFFGR